MAEYRVLKREECGMKSTFWDRYIDLVWRQVIPYQWEILNNNIPDSPPSHAIDNFKIAAGEREGRFYGEVFQDSDVYKWLEAVGNILRYGRDAALEEKADTVIAVIERAQEADGYLNTYFTIEEPERKWTNVLECHELYCAGHFIEAAVAYYLSTDKKKVLEIAVRLADHIDSVFGEEEGKLHGYPGHQEIELALLKLYKVTGEARYLQLAGYFIDTRGTNDFFEQEFVKRKKICFWNKSVEKVPNRWYNQFPYSYYNQFQLPVREQKQAVGHAVRAVYMYTAMAELAAINQDQELFAACQSIFEDITKKQMYITGGIGATHSGEAFTVGYDLPNDTNYSETCASIGLMFFAQKMLNYRVDHSYADVIEQALYNTVLGGMNYEGNRFFYVNPLAVVPESCAGNTERNHVKPIRQKWFSCACCPPNIARTIPDLWEYLYTADENTIYAHQFIGNHADIELPAGMVHIEAVTDYPWDHHIHYQIKADMEQELAFAMRIPGWCSSYQVYVDQERIELRQEANGYIYLKRSFQTAVKIELVLAMEPLFIQANEKVHYNAGRTAMMRGPIVYCLEEADNGKYLGQIAVDTSQPLEIKRSDAFAGAVFLEGGASRKLVGKQEALYAPYQNKEEEIRFTAIPYFLWNNREAGEMQVWVRAK